VHSPFSCRSCRSCCSGEARQCHLVNILKGNAFCFEFTVFSYLLLTLTFTLSPSLSLSLSLSVSLSLPLFLFHCAATSTRAANLLPNPKMVSTPNSTGSAAAAAVVATSSSSCCRSSSCCWLCKQIAQFFLGFLLFFSRCFFFPWWSPTENCGGYQRIILSKECSSKLLWQKEKQPRRKATTINVVMEKNGDGR